MHLLSLDKNQNTINSLSNNTHKTHMQHQLTPKFHCFVRCLRFDGHHIFWESTASFIEFLDVYLWIDWDFLNNFGWFSSYVWPLNLFQVSLFFSPLLKDDGKLYFDEGLSRAITCKLLDSSFWLEGFCNFMLCFFVDSRNLSANILCPFSPKELLACSF